MRVYLPVTLPLLAAAHSDGALRPGEWAKPLHDDAAAALVGYAVTPAVREWYVEGDLEELEFTAMTDAAQAVLRLLAADPSAPRRRVVLAADVPDGAVRPAGGGRSQVLVAADVALAGVASVHVDEAGVEGTVEAAVAALPAADAGDDDAQFALDEAEANDLLWYDVTEIPDLL
ncbi:hypothetical protein [Kineosporia sp. A_224]|jgi:hypothetical protein|uniref:DUF6912 family protein n=1 Tax=Kineosporia sp. A_224 TaxID=1962180 RepID=UPI000B4B053B|nr:hypothetical protein [Kineosporia sp. A_224]